MGDPAADAPTIRWARTSGADATVFRRGAYINYMGDEGETGARGLQPAKYERLVA